MGNDRLRNGWRIRWAQALAADPEKAPTDAAPTAAPTSTVLLKGRLNDGDVG
jgi:hypothetical protein